MKKPGICKIILCILAVLLAAESVETEAQTDYRLSFGCDGIQGYYYSKPLPKNDFTEYLKR